MNISADNLIEETSKFSMNDQGREVREHTQKRQIASVDIGSNYDLVRSTDYYAGKPHPFDGTAYLKSIDVERLKTAVPGSGGDASKMQFNWWDATLVYSTASSQAAEKTENPMLQRVQREWGTHSQTLYFSKDRDGNPILNGAKQPFDGGVPATVELPTLTFTRNEEGFNGVLATLLCNSVNVDYFAGGLPGTWKLKIAATEKYDWSIPYWTVRYEMMHLSFGWQPKPINAGLYELRPIVGPVLPGASEYQVVRCRDRDLQDVTQPVPLTTSGRQIPPDDLPDAANYITANVYPEIFFGSLGLSDV